MKAAIKKKTLGVMTTDHPRWQEFVDKLYGLDGCNFQRKNPKDPMSVTWKCGGGNSTALARRILREMRASPIDITNSVVYFREHGGYCDCEILFNVDR